MARHLSGFTLIELLIALAITAILAGIVYPSYCAQTLYANRNRAEVVLMQLAGRMELYAGDHQNSYEGATLADLKASSLTDNVLYQVKIRELSADHFVLEAVPINKQAEQDLECGTLSLSDANVRGISGGGAVELCWR